MLSPAKNGYLVVSGVDRFDEINQMEDHNRWPAITWMAVKRTTADWSKTQHGLLRVKGGRVPSTVFDNHIFNDVIASYTSFDDLLDDGWRVD